MGWKPIYIFALMLLHYSAFAQNNFMKLYGYSGVSEGSLAIKQTSDGGYIIGGSGSGFMGYALKTDSLGDTLWTKTYPFANRIRAIVETPDGGYLFSSNYLIKTNSTGDTLWTRIQFGIINWLDKTSDGGYILAGSKNINGFTDVLLIKINSSYNELWLKTFGNINLSELANEVQETTDGGFIVGGRKVNGSTYVDVNSGWIYEWFDSWLIKTDSAGNQIWNVIYDTPDSASEIKAVRQINDGGYILAVEGLGIWGDPYPMYLIKTNFPKDAP